MVSRILTGNFFPLSAFAAVLILSSCARAPRPVVGDFDTYQTITLGSANYMTGDGIAVTESGRGYVVHQIAALPDTMVRVAIDTNPPRSFKFDSDAEKRRFLDEIDNAVLRSVQASRQPVKDGPLIVSEQRWMKVITEGQTRDGEKLTGVMLIIREGDRTATIKAIGPHANRLDINRAVESLGSNFRFQS